MGACYCRRRRRGWNEDGWMDGRIMDGHSSRYSRDTEVHLEVVDDVQTSFPCPSSVPPYPEGWWWMDGWMEGWKGWTFEKLNSFPRLGGKLLKSWIRTQKERDMLLVSTRTWKSPIHILLWFSPIHEWVCTLNTIYDPFMKSAVLVNTIPIHEFRILRLIMDW